jgi:hypothetical protein
MKRVLFVPESIIFDKDGMDDSVKLRLGSI